MKWGQLNVHINSIKNTLPTRGQTGDGRGSTERQVQINYGYSGSGNLWSIWISSVGDSIQTIPAYFPTTRIIRNGNYPGTSNVGRNCDLWFVCQRSERLEILSPKLLLTNKLLPVWSVITQIYDDFTSIQIHFIATTHIHNIFTSA
jgi:hypothetical protein